MRLWLWFNTYRTRDKNTRKFKPDIKGQGRVYSQALQAKRKGPGNSILAGGIPVLNLILNILS